MAQFTEDNFSHVVPGAASRSGQFLGVVQQRCREEELGIDLQPTKPKRREDRVVLHADLVIGHWARRGRPMQLEVHADPTGSSLHVGWMVTKNLATGILANSDFVRHYENKMDMKDASADNVRALNGILQAFHVTVFLPVLQQLVDATQRSQTQEGFFGA